LVEIVNGVLFTASGWLKINEKSFDSVGGYDRFLPMKRASLKIKQNEVNGLDKYRDYTGAELCSTNCKHVPAGFYRNVDRSYKGIVFRDTSGNCTYFDRTHNLVYPLDKDIWNETVFNLIPYMESFTVGFEKKAKKMVDTVSV
jgi:hypothetical protein